MKISIIIPAYNVAPWLRPCLDSVLAQTDDRWEAVCVDDGSTDESGRIFDEYAQKDGRFKVIHSKNEGLGPARDKGLDAAEGEWIGLLDGDDVIAPCYVEACISAVQQCPSADIVRFGRVDFEDGESCEWQLPQSWKVQRKTDIRHYCSFDSFQGFVWERLYRRCKVSSLRNPRLRPGQDWVWKVDAVLCSDELVDVSARLYGYRQRKSAITHSRQSLKNHESSILWRLYVLLSLSKASKKIDVRMMHWICVAAVEGSSEHVLPVEEGRAELWSVWFDALRQISRAEKVPFWFHCVSRLVSLTRSKMLAYVLLVLPYKLKCAGFHR